MFEIVEEKIIDGLKNGKNMIYDATNINYKKRMAFLQKINKMDVEKIAIMVATPYNECLERNASRERQVPEEVIKRMYYNFYVPQCFEGFNKIHIIYNETRPLRWEDLLKKMDILQDNPHHTLTIKEHCEKVQEQLLKEPYQWHMKDIGLLHDIGKVQTKTFINTKGEKTDIAHYFNHEKVSAYISCLRINGLWQMAEDDVIRRAGLIRWHMLMHFNLSEKSKIKYRNMLGKVAWYNLKLLHEADCEAR